MAERTAASAPLALVLLCALASVSADTRAQTTPTLPDQPPSGRRRIAPDWGGIAFETASVRLSTSTSKGGTSNFPIGIYDFYSNTGGAFSAKNYPLIAYIAFAYKISGNDSISLDPQLPVWVRTTRYDIEGQAADRMATKDQMRLMVQSLLADRFNFKIHAETKTVPVYALVLSSPGRTGPQLQPHPPGDKTCSTKVSSKEIGMSPATCSGISWMRPRKPGNLRIAARNVDFDRIPASLPGIGSRLDRQVFDQTGLSGQYDFNLEWTPVRATPLPTAIPHAEPNQPDPNFAAFTRALDEQLGLKLIPQEAPMQVLVLDHIEKPSENQLR